MINYPTAKIICDSISPDNIRLTTMEVKIHRFVLAELNTHRVFSRNSASSRAIPVKKILERVKTDPAMPLFWGKNQAGMGAVEELNETQKNEAIVQWLLARDQAIKTVESLLELGLHKQLTNRLLEPWLWHTAIISSTEWDNFFGQRCAINPETNQPYAQPEMHYAAMAMQKAYYESTPNYVNYGQWHLPYINEIDKEWCINSVNKEWCSFNHVEHTPIKSLQKISAGRCARVSYLTHDGKRDPLEDIKLAEKLYSATPMHPSPFEHIATPIDFNDLLSVKGNFKGWRQYRHLFDNETVKNFIPNHPDLQIKQI
jgi:thymidylate synthase ThyX